MPDDNGEPRPQVVLANPALPELTLPELREALSLVCNMPIDFGDNWHNYGDVLVFSSGVISGPVRVPSSFLSGDAVIGPEQWSHAVDVLRQRRQPGANKRLDLAIQRWWSSKTARDRTHRLIDIRIALECLYLPDTTEGELRFRLAARGAWHLGNTYQERKGHWDTLRDAYDLASSVVHTGDVDEKPAHSDTLTRAQDLCRAGILKRLKEGDEPSWNDLVLGKQTHEV